MDPTPPPSPDTINSKNSISSIDRLNLNDLHTIFCDYGKKIVEQQGQVECMKGEMGRDYLHFRVDVLNMPQRSDHVEKLTFDGSMNMISSRKDYEYVVVCHHLEPAAGETTDRCYLTVDEGNHRACQEEVVERRTTTSLPLFLSETVCLPRLHLLLSVHRCRRHLPRHNHSSSIFWPSSLRQYYVSAPFASPLTVPVEDKVVVGR
ncbi:unnamed protein product [Lactuca saligna]|uniref:Uncharacterized protein n=1 Tax=Lactuca saligna TaxID=75948 RepID=A0AA35YGC0_LACSI|nr:unnamed protein product [Lactuca saligna]